MSSSPNEAANATMESNNDSDNGNELGFVQSDHIESAHKTEPDQLQSDSRLHAATLWLPTAEAAISGITPVVIGSLFVGPIAFLGFAGFLVIITFNHAVQYYTLRYRVQGQRLVIHSGILNKRERRIPLDRVQELQIQQGVLHRLLGFAKLQISTAGSDANEADLDALTVESAEQLKHIVAVMQSAASPATHLSDNRQTTTPDFAFEVGLRTLILGGVTSRVVAFVGAVVGAIAYFQVFGAGRGWLMGFIPARLRERFRFPSWDGVDKFTGMVPDSGVSGFIADFWFSDNLAKSLLFAIGGVLITVVIYVFRYYDFRLNRTGDALSTSHGLLTYQHGGLRRTRIQALKLEEGILRRWCGLATIRVDSAGDHTEVDEKKSQDVLVPIVRQFDADRVAKQVLPNLRELTPIWTRVSPLAIRRGCKKGWALILLAMLIMIPMAGWYCLLLTPAFPLVYLLNERWYHHTGYYLDEDHLLYRSGWWSRSTICVPTQNIQSLELTQSPFDRRLALATLQVDIAGQANTGGGPEIRNLPIEVARDMHRRLSEKAATTDFNW